MECEEKRHVFKNLDKLDKITQIKKQLLCEIAMNNRQLNNVYREHIKKVYKLCEIMLKLPFYKGD